MFFVQDQSRKTQRKVSFEMKAQLKTLMACGVSMEHISGLVDPAIANHLLGRRTTSLSAAAALAPVTIIADMTFG